MEAFVVVAKNIVYNVPILYHFRNQFSLLTLIYDEKEEKQAYTLKEGLEFLKEREGLEFRIELKKIDEDNPASITSTIPKKPILLFLSDNIDPTLNYFLSQAVMSNKGKIISYDKIENSYNIISQEGVTNHTLHESVPLEIFFKMAGYEVSYKTPTLYDKALVERIFKDFRALQKPFKKNFPAEAIREYMERNGYKEPKSALGFAFEEFIYWKLYSVDWDDIAWSLSIEKDGVKNEFDVAMIKDNHLILVECKYKRSLIDSASLVYKLDALSEDFGDDTQAFLVHIGHKVTRTNRRNDFDLSTFVSNAVNQRARCENIYIYHKHYFDPKIFYRRLQMKFNLFKRGFLLGKCDLEMAVIEKVLRRYNQQVFNKRLSQEGKLSDYQEFFTKPLHFFGVELEEDITPPKLYTPITHSNSQSLGALEQVLSILKVKPSRFHKLVALRDKRVEKVKEMA